MYTRIDHLQPGLSSILLGDDLGSFSRTSKTIQHKYLDYWITVACMERRETSGEAKRAARRTRGSAPKRPESQWDKFYFLSSVHMSQCDCVIWYLLEILEAKQTSKLPNVKLVLVQAGWMENEKCGGVRSAEYGKWGKYGKWRIWKMWGMENEGYDFSTNLARYTALKRPRPMSRSFHLNWAISAGSAMHFLRTSFGRGNIFAV